LKQKEERRFVFTSGGAKLLGKGPPEAREAGEYKAEAGLPTKGGHHITILEIPHIYSYEPFIDESGRGKLSNWKVSGCCVKGSLGKRAEGFAKEGEWIG